MPIYFKLVWTAVAMTIPCLAGMVLVPLRWERTFNILAGAVWVLVLLASGALVVGMWTAP